MPKDDFIDLFDAGSEEEQIEDEGTLATVIKNDELAVEDRIELVTEHKVIESDSFKLKLFMKEGVVDSIGIECRCGRSANIQLDYKKPSNGDDTVQIDQGPEIIREITEKDLPDFDESSPTGKTQEDFSELDTNPEPKEDEEFEEGISASSLNDLSQHNIVSPSSDESEETQPSE